MKLGAKELRVANPTKAQLKKLKKNEIYIVLDNVLDTYNIGSIFRLADAVAAKKVYLCGQTATPPNHRIKKASINTTEWVEWEYNDSAVEAISKVRSFVASAPQDDNLRGEIVRKLSNLTVVAVEQDPRAVPFNKFEYRLPICLVVGNETTGVSKEVLEMAETIVELPMFGVNISLNVMVSLGIVLYQVVCSLDSRA